MPLDYIRLSKAQKIAALLITIGPDAAAEVMNNFELTLLEQICREIAALPMIDAAMREELMKEFTDVITTGLDAELGGVGFAQTVLAKAKGDYTATAILSRCASDGPNQAGEEIRQLEGRQVVNLMKAEQPQTVAFVISCMDTPKAAEVLQMLPEALREEVVERLGAMEPTSTESIHKIASKLNSRIDRKAMQQGLHRGGGVKACANILNALDKELRKSLLGKIEERNATLGAAIRRKVFSFEDIVRITPQDLARVMREVDSADLPIALKTQKPAVVKAVLGTMSKRAEETLKEEIEILAPPRQKDVEAAQDRIIAIVRRLEEAEEITIDGGAAEPNAGT
jgi:flagellar motor switch protein FliG